MTFVKLKNFLIILASGLLAYWYETEFGPFAWMINSILFCMVLYTVEWFIKALKEAFQGKSSYVQLLYPFTIFIAIDDEWHT